MQKTNDYSNFINRKEEIKLLNKLLSLDGLIVLLGRRRVGKTALLKNLLHNHKNAHTIQCINASSDTQLSQITEDLSAEISFPAKPKNWLEFFRLLDAIKIKRIICIDEFQYLIKSDPSLPSVIQMWLDQENKSKSLLILSGSSTKLMTQACLDSRSPLYGRARQIVNIYPMSYVSFCEYLKVDTSDKESFRLYSLVGGIPKYWEHLQTLKKILGKKQLTIYDAVDYLFFGNSPQMEGEIYRFLSDEKIEGLTPLAVLEAVGRGVSRPSEIANRLNVAQNQLHNVLQQLISAKILSKEVPFNAPLKNNKIVNYLIKDPSILSWYKLSSTHGNRWLSYSKSEQIKILDSNTGNTFENYVRENLIGAERYWNFDFEIDAVRIVNKDLYVSEIKWSDLSKLDQDREIRKLTLKVSHINTFKEYPNIYLELYDRSFLKTQEPVLVVPFQY